MNACKITNAANIMTVVFLLMTSHGAIAGTRKPAEASVFQRCFLGALNTIETRWAPQIRLLSEDRAIILDWWTKANRTVGRAEILDEHLVLILSQLPVSLRERMFVTSLGKPIGASELKAAWARVLGQESIDGSPLMQRLVELYQDAGQSAGSVRAFQWISERIQVLGLADAQQRELLFQDILLRREKALDGSAPVHRVSEQDLPRYCAFLKVGAAEKASALLDRYFVGSPFRVGQATGSIQIGVDPRTLIPGKTLQGLDRARMQKVVDSGHLYELIEVDSSGRVLDGNHRLKEALERGRSVDVVVKTSN